MSEKIYAMVLNEPGLTESIRSIVGAGTPKRVRMRGTPELALGVAAFSLAYPILRFVLVEIGFPWLYEARRYSEVWRIKVHSWIDRQYAKQGIDTRQAKQMAAALRRELDSVTNSAAREAWKRLLTLIKSQEQDRAEDKTSDSGKPKRRRAR